MPLFHKPKLPATTPPSPEELVRKFTSKKESGVLAALSLSSAVALSVSKTGPASNVPANYEDNSPQTVPMIADGSIPEYTDNQKEAWMAAHREMPQARGAEKVLNKIGMSIIRSLNIHTPTSRQSPMWIFLSVLTFTGKRVSRTV